MMYLYTDLRMEDLLRRDTWVGSMPELGDALYLGRQVLFRCDGRDDLSKKDESGRLNPILGTDIQWNRYAVDPALQGMDCILFLLIRRFLREGANMVLYMPGELDHLDPDSWVSRIDVSAKRPGMTLMHSSCSYTEDTLYHFTNTGRCEHACDSGLLERIGLDTPACRSPHVGFIPSDKLTVDELIRSAGNFPTMVTIHDYDRCMESASLVPPGEHSFRYRTAFPRTLEAIVTPELCRRWVEDGEARMPITLGRSRYSESRACMYRLFSNVTASTMYDIGIGDVPVDVDEICLAIMIKDDEQDDEVGTSQCRVFST